MSRGKRQAESGHSVQVPRGGGKEGSEGYERRTLPSSPVDSPGSIHLIRGQIRFYLTQSIALKHNRACFEWGTHCVIDVGWRKRSMSSRNEVLI